jgi:hypothetical protein
VSAMSGVITARTVIANTATVLALYGPRCYLRCLLAAIVPGQQRTFLSIVFS